MRGEISFPTIIKEKQPRRLLFFYGYVAARGVVRDARWSAFGGCRDPLLQGRIQGVEIGVGDPVEYLGHMAVDGDIVYEVEWLLATPLLELCIHRLVDIQRWLAHMQEMRSKTMLEDGHVVELMDVLPMQIVVVAEQEDAMALLLPLVDQS